MSRGEIDSTGQRFVPKGIHTMGKSDANGVRRPWSVWAIVGLLVFTGLGALMPGWAMVTDPSGQSLGMSVEWLRNPLFPDFLVPGLFLAAVIGIGGLIVAMLFLLQWDWAWGQKLNPFRAMHWTWTLTLLQGLVITLWIVIQYFSMDRASYLQATFLAIGLAIILLLFEPRLHRYFSVRAERSVPSTSSR